MRVNKIPIIFILYLFLNGCGLNPFERKEFSNFFYQSVDLTDNLIFYHFNETGYTGLGSDVIDDSGRGRHSDSVNGLTKERGIYGEGMYCDGNGSGVNLSVSEFDDAFTERTISIWFRADDISDTHIIFEEGGNVNGINIYIESGVLYGHVYRGAPAPYTFQAFQSKIIEVSKWYHAVITFHDTEGFLMFVDGKSVGAAIDLGGNSFPSHSDGNGLCYQNSDAVRHDGSTSNGGDNHPFIGVLDEFAVWNRRLGPSEINDLYLRQGRL